jgi:ABC-type uncharacterized transport system substrate-binding protein
MLKLLRNIWLGLTLIFLASGLLLFSDLGRRQNARPAPKALPRLAVMQWASTDLLDHTVEGIVEGLRQQGFESGRTAEIRLFNASGDSATGNTMAHELAGGGYDLILTASTVAMQAVAKANAAGRVVHVFGGVTDPYGSGVGISGPEPAQHPPHLVGVGTFQPVEHAIGIARQMNPTLAKLGVVWNPGESNSEACVSKARAACQELGIQLLEANAGSSPEVPEAVRSILAQGAEAIWVGGDMVATAGLGAILAAARTASCPVFTNDPNDTAKGALFGLGASYHTVGLAAGEMAGKILHGADPRSFGVKNLVPEVLTLNEPLAAGLRGWSIPADLRAQAQASVPVPSAAVAPRPAAGRTYTVGLLYFGPNPIFDLAIAGVREALADAGFVEGQNLVLRCLHPNNDMSLLPQVAGQLAGQDLDLLIPLSTPCLGATLAKAGKTPVVFGIVSAPLEAGAGTSYAEHLPRVTGAVWTAPNPALFQRLRELYPACRNVGVIYNPSEANSRREKERAKTLLAEQGMTLVERTVSSSSEVPQALQSLLAAPVDAVFGMADNTVVSAFAGLAQICRRERIPLLADDNSLMGSGALFTCGASPPGEGRHCGRLAARVLLGESPAGIPFEPSTETQTAVDLAAAAALGVTLPATLLREASVYHHVSARHGRPFRLAMVSLVQNPLLETAAQGVLRGLGEAGFKETEDYTVTPYNAQGEIAQLPALLDAARTAAPDLIVTLTTPALLAAAQRGADVPIVFAVASDPAALGLFTPENRPAHITGVHDDPPVERLLEMARRHDPRLSAVGILYDPAQANSLISVKKLRRVCLERGVTLHEATAATVSELPAAAQSVIQRRVGAILLSADNLVVTGFPAILNAAKSAGVPIYATDPGLVKQGAAGAVGDSYAAWGVQAGHLAAKVLAGCRPSDLPVEATRVQEVIEPAATVATAVPTPAGRRTRPWEVRIMRYNDAQFATDSERGIRDGFRKQGLVEGRDLNLRSLNAQGDMTTLTSIVTAVSAEQPDLIMPISTPALQAALRQITDRPLVFSCVADGVLAGAGVSATEHRPNVTGISSRHPAEAMARLLKQCVPGLRAVGTLFSPGEVNAEHNRKQFAAALEKEGLTLIALPVASSSETAEATTALLRSDIQIICQIMDNTTRPAFAQMAKRADEAGLAFFCFDSSALRDGAALALARDFYDAGSAAAALAVRVLRGEAPQGIPFADPPTEVLLINPELLTKRGLVLPPEYAARARTVQTKDP